MRAQWITIALCLIATAAVAGFSDFCFNGLSLTGGAACKEQVPVLTITPSSYTFADTTTGKTRVARFVISNTGKGTLSNISTSKSSGVFRTFSSAANCGNRTLAAGQQCQYGVEYKPVAAVMSRYSSLVSTGQFVARVVQLQGTGVAGSSGASDDFNRADAATLGANWATPTGLGVLRVVTNQVRVTSDGTVSVSNWVSTDLSTDHCSQITISTSGSGQASPVVRSSATEHTHYRVLGTTLRRYNAGSATVLSGGSGSVTATTSGDTRKICAKGSVITVYKNGSLEYTHTDSTPINTGYAGIMVRYGDERSDNWSGSVAP